VAVVQYTFTQTHTHTHTHTHNTQNETKPKYIEQQKNFGRVRAVPRFCGFYLGICQTTEEKARKNLTRGSRGVSAGTMNMHKHNSPRDNAIHLTRFPPSKRHHSVRGAALNSERISTVTCAASRDHRGRHACVCPSV
jgi:hypothetical protein